MALEQHKQQSLALTQALAWKQVRGGGYRDQDRSRAAPLNSRFRCSVAALPSSWRRMTGTRQHPMRQLNNAINLYNVLSDRFDSVLLALRFWRRRRTWQWRSPSWTSYVPVVARRSRRSLRTWRPRWPPWRRRAATRCPPPGPARRPRHGGAMPFLLRPWKRRLGCWRQRVPTCTAGSHIYYWYTFAVC